MFVICDDQQTKIDAWFQECEAKLSEKLGGKNPKLCYGAIGGVLTYHFTPTSIGTVVIVSFDHPAYQSEIDVSDYESW